jgi:hypothetical protein
LVIAPKRNEEAIGGFVLDASRPSTRKVDLSRNVIHAFLRADW